MDIFYLCNRLNLFKIFWIYLKNFLTDRTFVYKYFSRQFEFLRDLGFYLPFFLNRRFFNILLLLIFKYLFLKVLWKNYIF